MQLIVPIIIAIIIGLQTFFFVKNLRRMQQFKKIFNNPGSWHITRNIESNLVDGVQGEGNNIFRSIISSINKYLGYNAGSVIDFGLLKDAVDRHCDSVENDIATQTPIPLYWGLAGTMLGVIVGLWDLLDSNAIITLMGSSGNQISSSAENAALGVDALLSGVAWAMVASICGILLTTINSLLFKKCKLQEENGKNSFLAWMQSELLPELPTDTSEALNNLVRNLNRFNYTFAENTSNLRDALRAVNESYAIQADIIKAVHDMDIMKMAKANVNVLRELQECTDKLEAFNQYLNDIKGYTDAIHRFETLFNEETEKIHILEQIRDFFREYKGSISKVTADADRTLKDSLNKISNSTSTNVDELNKRFLDQSQTFKAILESEKKSFEDFIKELQIKFKGQMDQMPQLSKQLAEISAIPGKLDQLIKKIEDSNKRLVSDVASSMKQAVQASKVPAPFVNGGSEGVVMQSTPSWMKLTGLIGIIIIAIACIFNVITYFFPREERTNQIETVVDSPSLVVVEEAVDTVPVVTQPAKRP